MRTASKLLMTPQKGGGLPAWLGTADAGWDFQRGITYGQAVNPTVTRASTEYAPNAAGVYLPYANNVPAQNDNGLQTDTARTNRVQNNSMTGGVSGSPGTRPNGWAAYTNVGLSNTQLTFGIASNGLPNVIARVQGTASGTPYQHYMGPANLSAEPVSASTVYTASWWARLVAGALPSASAGLLTLRIQWYDAAGVALGITDMANCAINGTLTRYSGTATSPVGAAFATMVTRWAQTAGDVVDITYELAGMQLEAAGYASSPILTTGAVATRQGDFALISGMGSSLQYGVAGFIQIDNRQLGDSTNNPTLLAFDDGTGNNRAFIYQNSTNLRLMVTVAAVQSADIILTSIPLGIATVVFAAGLNFVQARVVGGALGTLDTNCPWPVIDRIQIGGRMNGVNNNNYQSARKLSLEYATASKPVNQAMFDRWYANGQLAQAA